MPSKLWNASEGPSEKCSAFASEGPTTHQLDQDTLQLYLYTLTCQQIPISSFIITRTTGCQTTQLRSLV
ncbi:unnamed protein product [Coffea canephora]|uniref:Uncharacterized protein n=1 Tax=Coffea canephora TaxID=49390 RepID=A0A068TNA4_COFCA|nr:unnamed protein product [Coffea canephora]